MKKIVLGLLLAIVTAGAASAQTATSTSTTASGAMAATILAPGAIAGTTIIGAGLAGAGAASSSSSSSGGFNQPQMVMNTAAAPSTSTFNDCGIAWSAGLWLLSGSRNYESEECKAQRQAVFAAVHLKSPAIAFESMCAIESFRAAVARTNEQQCAQTIADRNAAAAKAVAAAPRPVAAAPVAPVRVAVTFDPTPYPSCG